MTITFVGGDNRSPFDQIKKTRPDGSEYWSARELAPVMGYSAWRNLEVPINRAISSAINQGIDVATNFAGSRKITATKPQEDYELSRFAAYLVAMNGDPNKPEVAGAQAYFAVRTREAEVAKPALDLSSLDSISAILDAGKAALNRAQEAERRAAKSEGVVAAITKANGITLREFHKQYFSEVPERQFFDKLYSLGLLIDQRGKGSKRDDGTFRDGPQHRHPSYKGKAYIYLYGTLGQDGIRRESPKVRPGQPEVDLAELLASKGLPPNPNQLPSLSKREISA